MPNTKPKIVVIGAGIIGASTTLHLAKSGADVELIDESTPSNQATIASFGWINANTPTNKNYFRFRMNAIDRWKTLIAEYPSLPVRFSGSIDWDMDENEIEPTHELYQELGYDSDLIDTKRIEELVPTLEDAPKVAIINHSEGVANPDLIANAFVELAKQHGATVRSDTKVEWLDTTGNQVNTVVTQSGRIDCDYVIVCTGTQTGTLLSPLGIEVPLDKIKGMLARTNPLGSMCDYLVSMPDLHFWQMEDGSLIVGENQAGDTLTTSTKKQKQLFHERLNNRLPQTSDTKIETISTGTRPVPSDGMPIVGAAGSFSNLYVAVLHSGITLAPIIGSSLAREIIRGETERNLEDYRLARFDQLANTNNPLTAAGASA